MKPIIGIVAAALVAALGTVASAGTIDLSDYLGGASGGSVAASNAPYTTFNYAQQGFGVDSPGNFSTKKIQFADTAAFDKGIGAHPESSITFHLDALRLLDSTVDTFSARIGIHSQEVFSANGATFMVFLDGVKALEQSVAGVASPSLAISLDVSGATSLRLETHYNGFPNYGNLAAWADAKLVDNVQAVPLPPAAWMGLGMLGLIGLARRKKRKSA